MANGDKTEQDANLKKEPDAPEQPFKERPQAMQLIGGEFHVVADPATGAISVKSPPNVVAALGLALMGVLLVWDDHKQKVQKANLSPKIVKAGADALAKLKEGVH